MAHTPTSPAAPTRATFTFVFITVALDMLALGIMVPVLPKLVVQLEGGDIARAASLTGVFGFAWAAMQFIAAPLLGLLSDRFGRRPVILLSCLGLGLDYLLMALAPSVAWLFVGRMLSGVTSASFPSASAYIADVTPPEQRAARFGLLGAAFGLGFVVGPAVGGVLGSISLRLPFWASAVLCLLNVAYGFFVLPESLPRERRATSFQWRKANPVAALRLFLEQRTLLGLAAVAALLALAHESLPSVFVLSMDARFAWTERDVGLSLAAVGIVSTVMAATVVGPLTRRIGEQAALLWGLLFAAAGMGFYGLAGAGWLVIVGIVVQGPSGIANPALMAILSRRMPPTRQGELQGAMGSLRGVMGMIGPLLFTQVLALSLGKALPIHLPGAPFVLAALLLLAAAAVAGALKRSM